VVTNDRAATVAGCGAVRRSVAHRGFPAAATSGVRMRGVHAHGSTRAGHTGGQQWNRRARAVLLLHNTPAAHALRAATEVCWLERVRTANAAAGACCAWGRRCRAHGRSTAPCKPLDRRPDQPRVLDQDCCPVAAALRPCGAPIACLLALTWPAQPRCAPGAGRPLRARQAGRAMR
jgi:hypothetical protein